MIINSGNIEDIRASLRFLAPDSSISKLKKEIEAERKHLNRTTVIKMIEREIKKRSKLKSR